jgi:hypothetical protein
LRGCVSDFPGAARRRQPKRPGEACRRLPGRTKKGRDSFEEAQRNARGVPARSYAAEGEHVVGRSLLHQSFSAKAMTVSVIERTITERGGSSHRG